MRAPIKPTQKMIEDHSVSHLPFRSWCVHCVRGRAKSVGHFAQKESEKENQQVPTISMDYGFFGTENESDHEHPVLILHDRESKERCSHPVPSKGIVHPYPAKAVVSFLNRLGYKKAILKSDQEPAIVALGRAVKNQWGGELLLEYSPKGESQSNGEIERTVQSIQGLARTLKDAIEENYQIELDSKSPLLAWLVEYCGTLLNLFHVAEDGLTAYHRLKGKPWRVELPAFGEVVNTKERRTLSYRVAGRAESTWGSKKAALKRS